MAKVFRYESQSGYGPYSYENPDLPESRWEGDGWYGEMWAAHNDSPDHPVAWGSSGDCLDASLPWPIACPTLKEFKAWFDGFHGKLLRHGFRVRVYEVPDWAMDVGYSGKQVAFNLDYARRIK